MGKHMLRKGSAKPAHSPHNYPGDSSSKVQVNLNGHENQDGEPLSDSEVTVQKKGTAEEPTAAPWLQSLGGNFITGAIIINAIAMGFQHDLAKQPAWKPVFDALEHLFTGVFAIEMAVKLAHLRCKYFSNSWNIFDFGLVWSAIVEVWVLPALAGLEFGFNLSVLRIFRLLRLLRVLKFLRTRKELTCLIDGLIYSFRSIGWVCIFLFILAYVFAIISLDVIDKKSYEPDELSVEQFFGTMPRALLTLFNLALLEDWSDLAWPFLNKQPVMLLILMAYLGVATLGIMNLIVGIISERTMESAADFNKQIEERRKEGVMLNILSLADKLFENVGDGGLTRREFEKMYSENSELRELLGRCELPVGFTISDLHISFDDSFDDEVSKIEFVNGMLRLLFNNEFQTNCCIINGLRYVGHMMKTQQTQQHADIQAHFGDMHRDIGILNAKLSLLMKEAAAPTLSSLHFSCMTTATEVLEGVSTCELWESDAGGRARGDAAADRAQASHAESSGIDLLQDHMNLPCIEPLHAASAPNVGNALLMQSPQGSIPHLSEVSCKHVPDQRVASMQVSMQSTHEHGTGFKGFVTGTQSQSCSRSTTRLCGSSAGPLCEPMDASHSEEFNEELTLKARL